MEMNNLKSASKLRIGQELIIPKPVGSGTVLASARAPEPSRRAEPAARARSATAAKASVPAGHQRTVIRVAPGDTLWSIARRMGVQLKELCRWNGIDNPSRHKLLAGAHLVVYTERVARR
jgi:membrane-bound lytic murein transglycosylase D